MPPVRSIRVAALLATLTAGGAVPSARAQTAVGPAVALPSFAAGHTEPRPMTSAVPRSGPVSLDGRLNEAAWAVMPVARDFTQQDPHEGEPASQKTEVRFLFDEDALYIGARMYDSEGAAGVRSRLARRDQQSDGDYFAVVLDTYHDHSGRTWLQVNPAGVKSDLGQAAPYMDPAWDPVWQAATAVDSLGWTAELRVPWSQLRFPRDSIQTWGLQIWRYEERTNEYSMWAFWHKNESGGPPRFGHLRDLRFGRIPRAVELMPYAVSRAAYVRPQEKDSPFEKSRDLSGTSKAT